MSMNLEVAVMLLLLNTSSMLWIIAFVCLPQEARTAWEMQGSTSGPKRDEFARASAMVSICSTIGIASSVVIGLVLFSVTREWLGFGISFLLMCGVMLDGIRIIIKRMKPHYHPWNTRLPQQ